MNGNGYHTKLLSKTNNVTMAQVLGMDANDCFNVSVNNAENNQYHQECCQSQQLAMSQPSLSHIQAAAPNTTMMMIIDPRICRDYVRGVCKRGFSCKFVHQTVVTSDVAASFNFPLPSDNGMGGSKNFPGLDHQQQQYHLGACSSNSHICRDYQNGICTRGSSCKYQHINFDASQQHPHHQSSLNMDGTSTIVEDSTVMMSGGAGVVGGNTGSTTATDIDVGRRGGVVHEKAIPICRDYMKGKCERGFRCRFRHITMADYQQASLQLTVSGGPKGETNANGLTAAPTKYVKNQQHPQHAYEYSSHGGEEEVTYSPITASVVKSVIGCNGVSVSGDTASGSLLITRHAPPNQSATIQYSLPISVQSGHLTYVPASATINIVEPLIEPPLTKRRLCQISSSGAAVATFTNSSLFPTMHDDVSERNTINVITTMRETVSTNNNNKTGLANTAPSVNIITADASNMNFLIAAAAAVSASATEKESTEDSKSLNASSFNNVRDTTSSRTLKGSQQRMNNMFSVNTADTKDSGDTNGYNQSSTPITHTERALIEENESLKQRLDTLKKQITELNATVDMLLEQNKRLRMCGMVGIISTTTCNSNVNTNNSTSHNISLSSFSGGGAAQFAMATIASVAPSPLATPTPCPPYGHPQLQHHTNAATPLALFTPSVHPTLPLSVPLLTQSATAFMVAASSHPSPFVPTPLSSSTLPVSGATLTMVPCCVTPHHLSFPSHAFHGQQGPPQPQQPHHYVATWPILSSPSSSNNITMANSPPTSTTTPTTVSIHSTIPNSYVASRDLPDNDSYSKTNSTINISYNSNNIKLSKPHANSTLDYLHERKIVTAVSALSSDNRITNNDSHKNQIQSDLPRTTSDLNRQDGKNDNNNNLYQYLPANVAITVSSDVTGISNSAYINATESMAQDMKTNSASISRGKTTTVQSQSTDIVSNVLDSFQTFAQHTNSMNSNINNWNNTMDSSIGTNNICRSPINIPVPSPE